jgi:hypothetical protein
MTNKTINLSLDGKSHSLSKDSNSALFEKVKTAVLKRDEASLRKLLAAKSNNLYGWANGDFKVKCGQLHYKGELIHGKIVDRIFEMSKKGDDPQPLLRFFEKLKKNPSARSVSMTYDFITHAGIPLTKNGNFLAYKSIRQDWYDHHTGKILNKVGTTVKVDRNKVSDDPEQGCHFGLHVGAFNYASTFHQGGSRIVVCEVNPEHVVCVPKDHNHEKMRICEYTVLGVHGGPLLSSTVHDEKIVKTAKRKSHAFDKLTDTGLFDKTVDQLRMYASYIGIVGASRVKGGKIALVDLITTHRQ